MTCRSSREEAPVEFLHLCWRFLMFGKRPTLRKPIFSTRPASKVVLEDLEGRQLLSGSHHHGGLDRLFCEQIRDIIFHHAPMPGQNRHAVAAKDDEMTSPPSNHA